MDSGDTGKKSDRLARIRENQRKSRAKKQEYVRELEQKLSVCKEEANRRDVEHRIAVQKLEAENRKLKHLLSSMGLPSTTVDEYLEMDSDLAVTQKVAIPALRRQEAKCRPSGLERDGFRPLPSAESRTSVSSNTTPDEPHQANDGHGSGNDCKSLKDGNSRGFSQSTICGCAPSDTDLWPSNDDVLNTTLCAIAEELIQQYNTRGLGMEEIRKKLWFGFSKGLRDDGCRVQNQVLFEVLDEISNM
ncbi:hypothetical protein BDW42DRAFT_105939 [Aspergillus taichungensis]|uniref:BZIP domain-containing protein n=1 Tax=Aspergillus taichungensis TaxID=482145 RepID=A0A2J5HTY7_9EURO|nr:hypothetical protein BDW42DRAFT_105939 [Aspergillus taichungensis]